MRLKKTLASTFVLLAVNSVFAQSSPSDDCQLLDTKFAKEDPPRLKVENRKLLHSGPGLKIEGSVRCNTKNRWMIGTIHFVTSSKFWATYKDGLVHIEIDDYPALDTSNGADAPFYDKPIYVSPGSSVYDFNFADSPGGQHSLALRIPNIDRSVAERKLSRIDRRTSFDGHVVAISHEKRALKILRSFSWEMNFEIEIDQLDAPSVASAKRSLVYSESTNSESAKLLSYDWFVGAKAIPNANSQVKKRWEGAAAGVIPHAVVRD